MKIILLVLLLGIVACTDDDGTRKFLRGKSYTNIKTLGAGNPFDCLKNEMVTRFTAVDKNGIVRRALFAAVCLDVGWEIFNEIVLISVQNIYNTNVVGDDLHTANLHQVRIQSSLVVLELSFTGCVRRKYHLHSVLAHQRFKAPMGA